MHVDDILKLWTIVFFGLSVSSCGPELLKANFDSDTVGTPPKPNLPGSPEGDTIVKFCSVTTINSATLGSNALYLSNADDPSCTGKVIWFETADASESIQHLYFSFKGYVKGNGHREIWIKFGKEQDRHIFTLIFRGGNIFIWDSSPLPDELIGSYEIGEPHDILVRVDRHDDTYNLSIQQSGSPNVQLINRPSGAQEFLWDEPFHYLLLSVGDEDDITFPGGYVMDDLIISEGQGNLTVPDVFK